LRAGVPDRGKASRNPLVCLLGLAYWSRHE
jgi:hypothetical protein